MRDAIPAVLEMPRKETEPSARRSIPATSGNTRDIARKGSGKLQKRVPGNAENGAGEAPCSLPPRTTGRAPMTRGLPRVHFSANLGPIMRTDLDHLPAKKQRELGRVVEILFAEFEEAQALATSAKKKSGRILKIILFGSYARGGWVDEPHTAKGYLSDYDLLIVVNHRDLKDVATYWYKAEDRIIRDPSIKTPVNFIVHTLSEVNDALAKGQYFFSDIRREGIALYELPGHKLADPKPLTAEEAYEVAKGHYERWFPRIEDAREVVAFCIKQGNLNDAAFMLHQATERAYDCVLLVTTNYAPATHNIKFLRSLAESHEPRLIDAWPRETKHDRRRFELLKRAYVEARYSEHYKITMEELEWLGGRIERLRSVVEQACQAPFEPHRVSRRL